MDAETRKSVWLAAILSVVLALTFLTAFVWVPRDIEAEIDAAKEKIAANGDPVYAADLTKPPIPEEENAARLYDVAFGTMRESEEPGLQAAILGGELSLDDPAVMAAAQAYLANNRDALDLLCRASEMPRCRFDVDWSLGWDIMYHQHARLRLCARLLELQSMVLAQQGDAEQALATGMVTIRMSKAAKEPALIGPLVRYAIIEMGTRAVENALSKGQPPAEACRKAAAETAEIDLTEGFVRAVKGERALGISVMDKVRLADDPMATMSRMNGAPDDIGETFILLRPAMRWTAYWQMGQDELIFLEWMEKVVGEAGLPYREVASGEEFDEFVSHKIEQGYYPVMSAIMVPVYRNAYRVRDRAIVMLDLVQIGLLLKAYRAERGQYPESLEELAKHIEEELPDDPFSAEAYIYRREGGGFLLYSIGANLENDGGVEAPRGESHMDAGDILFRCAK